MAVIRYSLAALVLVAAGAAEGQNLFVNADLDADPDGWESVCGTPMTYVPVEDEAGCAGSGSLHVPSAPCLGFQGGGAGQCIPVVAGALIFVGIAMVVVDRIANGRESSRPLASITYTDAIIVGLAQSLALIPGVSRSGATICMALLLGFTRSDAARFSFLLSIPAIAGAGLFEARDAFRQLGRSACVVIICGISIVGLAMLWLTSLVPAESVGLRIALLTGYMLTFGLGFNGISPVYASAVSDRFAGKNLGTILGLLDLGFGLGSALGPWWAGWMFDRYGNYQGVIVGVALGVSITGLGLWGATRRRGA